jgi:hypothetical protein
MIVIGVDAHKRTHTLVAVDAATGACRGQRAIAASDDGALDALRIRRHPWTQTGCGRWRIVGMCGPGLSGRCWRPASG